MSRRLINSWLIAALVAVFFLFEWPVSTAAQPLTQRQQVQRQQLQQQQQLRLQQRQQQQQQRPAGPTAEDILRLFIPPEDQPGYVPDFRDFERRPAAEAPPPRRVPSANEVAGMTAEQQRALLRQALQSFDDRLSGMEIGPGWKKYLQTEQLGYHLWTNRDAEPNAAARVALGELAERYDSVAKNPQYRFLHDWWGFQTINRVLSEYVMSPVDRQRRETASTSGMLKSALDRTRTGPGWNKFLRLADIKRISESQGDVSEDDQALLREIADRFKKVSDESEYPVLNRTQGFVATRQSVEQLLVKASEPTAVDQAWARSELGHLVLDLKALKAGCQKEAEAIETWVMAPEGSDRAERARAVVMALKEENDKRSKEAMERVMGLIDSENRRHDAMGRLVLDLAAMKKELKAAETWVMAPEGSSDAEKARETVAAFIRHHEKERQEREQRIAKIIAGMFGGGDDSSSAMGTKTLVMPPEDSSKSATGTVVLAPENGDDAKEDDEVEHYLVPLPVPDDESAADKIRLIPPALPEDAEPGTEESDTGSSDAGEDEKRASEGEQKPRPQATFTPDLAAMRVTEERHKGVAEGPTSTTVSVKFLIRGVVQNVSPVSYGQGSGTADVRVNYTDGSFAVIQAEQIPDLDPNESFEVVGTLPNSSKTIEGYSLVINASDLDASNNATSIKVE